MALTITPLLAGDEVTSEQADLLVEAACDVLGGEWCEDVRVRFAIWRGEEGGGAYVCKVEALAADPFAMGASWRWWSPVVKDAQELRSALGEWMRHRRGREDRPAAESHEAPLPAAISA